MTENGERRSEFTAGRAVTTFNRKAILMSLMVVAVTVMVATFFLSPAPRRGPVAVDEISPERVGDPSSQQTYLARPPDTARLARVSRGRADVPPEEAPTSPPDAAPFDLYAEQALERERLRAHDVGRYPTEPFAGGSPVILPGFEGPRFGDPPGTRAEAPRSLEEELFALAMRCGVRTCPAEASEDTLAGRPVFGEHPARAPAAPVLPPPPEARVPNRYEQFLESAGGADLQTYVQARVQRPVSRYQLMAGTLIPVTLLTAINSDLPGEVIAQVTRNVYDTQQIHLLIPAGTRFLGKVDSNIALGQSRVNIGWYRMIFPDNRSISLPALAGVDREGAPGLRDRVNSHTGRNLMNALLLSAIGAGAQLSQPRRGAFSTPSAGELAAAGAAQQVHETSAELIRRGMNASPTLHVRQGLNFYVYVGRDLVLEPYPLQH